MAPVSQSIVRFSSQDPVHRAENVLPGRKGKWLSQKTDHTGQIELEIHLSQAIKIAFINIGNAGSAFIKILVGRSMWSQNQKYVTFLPTTTLMSPQDSKTGVKTENVKMLNKASFCKDALEEEWDRIQVICLQPFNRTKQFGLQFIDLIPGVKLTLDKEQDSTRTPAEELAQLKSILSPKNIKPSVPSCSPSSITSQSRAAVLVQAALKDRGKSANNMTPLTPGRKRNTDFKMRTSPYPVGGNAQSQCAKTRSRACAEDIEDEVECFLDGCKFEQMPTQVLEQIKYRNLKQRMEQQRQCPLSKSEWIIFFKLAKKTVTAAKAKREGQQERPSSDCEVIDSPPNHKSGPSTSQDTSRGGSKTCQIIIDDDCVEVPPSKRNPEKKPNSPEFIDYNDEFPLVICEDVATSRVQSPMSGFLDDAVISDDVTALSSSYYSEEILCPICYKTFPDKEITYHADVCAQSNFD